MTDSGFEAGAFQPVRGSKHRLASSSSSSSDPAARRDSPASAPHRAHRGGGSGGARGGGAVPRPPLGAASSAQFAGGSHARPDLAVAGGGSMPTMAHRLAGKRPLGQAGSAMARLGSAWNCPKCTFENGPTAVVCAMCNCPRPPPAEGPRPPMLLAQSPNDKPERPAEFHLHLVHLPGSTSPKEVLEYVEANAAQLLVRRVVVRYHREGVKETKNSRNSYILLHDVHGPSSDHDIVGSALVEFYPAHDMVQKLRSFTLRKPHNMISRVPAWNKSFVVPFFPADEVPGKPDVGAGGIAICPFARRQCYKDKCALAHEPEEWTESSEVTDSAILEKVISQSLAEYQERAQMEPKAKPQPPPVLVCNGCGIEGDRVILKPAATGQALYCPACLDLGVPKVQCAMCYRQTFQSAMGGSDGVCQSCLDSPTRLGGEDLFSVEPVAPHFKIVPRNSRVQIPSRFELQRLLEPMIEVPVVHVGYSGDGDVVPVTAFVRLQAWNETIAALAKGCQTVVPSCDVVLIPNSSAQKPDPVARRRALAKMVAAGDLLESEFRVLSDWLRG